MSTLYFLLFLITIFLLIRYLHNKNKWITPSTPIHPTWKKILQQKVIFYNTLSFEEKTQFEFKIQEFILNYRITGIDVKINITDKILVASSAIIPIFNFPHWKYTNFSEVLIYPRMFNDKFETSGPNRNIMGMVGTGYMNGKMILSKPALHLGFSNESDKKNTAIHEFVHIIDKADGTIDGIPELLMEKQYTIPWLELIHEKIEDIHEMDSDINPYGATSRVEFFAVASEYFFERPKLLAKKHPILYSSMEKLFNQDMAARNMKKTNSVISRNSQCPCNSGKKFKKCCGGAHYN